MKNYFTFLLAILFVTCSFCQKKSVEEYKAESRHLKTGGFILVGAGGAFTLTGLVLIIGDKSNADYNNNTLSSRSQAGVLLIAAGIVSELGSIPFFVVSRAIHKKASRIMRASTFIEIEKDVAPACNVIHLQPFPSLGVKISL